MDISKKIKFSEVCGLLENVKKVKTKSAVVRKNYLRFQKFRDEFRTTQSLQNQPEDGRTSFYCILRCLIPGDDTARDSYGIRCTSLAQIYTKVLQLPKESADAKKLRYQENRNHATDFADIVYTILRPRCRDEMSELSLSDIHRMLDSIAADDRRNTEKILGHLFEVASANEQKWFIRLLLKSMHLGIGRQQVFAAMHDKALKLYIRCSDLKKMCTSIENGEMLDVDTIIEPFQHIRPMLCERLDLARLYGLLGSDVLFIETKMDGERFHVHLNNETYKYISRNGRDYTAAFGKDHTEGNLTPLLGNQIASHVKSAIIDGEMMVWNKAESRFCVKGENHDVKHLPAGVGGNLRPCFVAYDLLYCNGQNMLEIAYVQRTQKLRDIFKESPGILQVARQTKLCTISHFKEVFNTALDANEEGVVIKKQKSTYEPNSRKGGWYKIKADYIEGLTSDFDVLIIGGYYNRSRTYVESYVVGVLKKISADLCELYSIGRVAQGLSREERIRLNDSLKGSWKSTLKDPPSKLLLFGSFNSQPDLWIEPSESTIIQVKASELAQSSSYATPFALRFPRIEAVRSDKVWNECMTLEEYEYFYKGEHGVKKLNKRGLDLEDCTVDQNKPKRKSTKSSTTAYASTFNANGIEKVSEVFEGFNFCILSASTSSQECYSIEDLKAMVIQNGGSLVENPSEKDNKCICIAGDVTFRVKMLRDTALYNIVSMNWLIEMCQQKRMQLKWRDMLCMTAQMCEQFKELYDDCGDSFTDPVDEKELKQLMDELERSQFVSVLTEKELLDLEEKIFDNNPNFFRGHWACFYNTNPKSVLAKLLFQWRGGICCSNLTSNDDRKLIQYIFVDSTDVKKETLEQWFVQTFRHRWIKIQIVSVDWILNSNNEKRKLQLQNFIVDL